MVMKPAEKSMAFGMVLPASFVWSVTLEKISLPP